MSENKERLWHRRFGHLNEMSFQKLVKKNLVSRLDYNTSEKIGTCESCTKGKQTKLSFKSSTRAMSAPLELVHSDLCGKMGEISTGGAEYFLTFLDHHTHYCWVYPPEEKSSFGLFMEL